MQKKSTWGSLHGITAEYAKEYAESEFEKYRVIQDRLFRSDFDKFDGEDPQLPLDIE
ncbi:Uncharacterised protein [Segatella copri]|nr:Uncharacterised protein [Segatella copri]